MVYKTDPLIVKAALKAAGLTLDRDDDISLYQSLWGSGYVSYKTLQKLGEPLPKLTLIEMGLPSRMKLGSQFFNTLNSNGKRNPINSAGVICGFINGWLRVDMERRKYADLGLKVRLMRSNMVSGPCAPVNDIGDVFEPHDAPFLPLATCCHPDQCACTLRSELT